MGRRTVIALNGTASRIPCNDLSPWACGYVGASDQRQSGGPNNQRVSKTPNNDTASPKAKPTTAAMAKGQCGGLGSKSKFDLGESAMSNGSASRVNSNRVRKASDRRHENLDAQMALQHRRLGRMRPLPSYGSAATSGFAIRLPSPKPLSVRPNKLYVASVLQLAASSKSHTRTRRRLRGPGRKH